MAITSEIIGKLGGADVEAFPVQTGPTTSARTLATVEIPDGEQWLVAVTGSSSTMPSISSQYPTLTAGGASSIPGERYGDYGVAIVASQNSTITLRPGTNASNFTGTVYTVKL